MQCAVGLREYDVGSFWTILAVAQMQAMQLESDV
jgi:hypothetical protein